MQQTDNYARLLAAHEDMRAGRHELARAALEELVSQGEQDALLYLGWMLEQGLGGSADAMRAEWCYQTLCDAGNTSACYQGATLKYRHGDVEGALDLYRRAADAGHPSAAYWVYLIYEDQGGNGGDHELAMRYLIQAAERGHAFARRDLARRRMRQPGRIHSRALAACQYVAAVLKGFTIIARDSNDPRVR